MPRARTAAAICLALGLTLTAGPAAADVHGVPLPRGTRTTDGRHASALGFRATIDHYAKLWRKGGIPVEATGPYRARGVDIMRFVRTDLAGEWLAVHVWRSDGITWISIVPRPSAPPAPTGP